MRIDTPVEHTGILVNDVTVHLLFCFFIGEQYSNGLETCMLL